MDGSKHTQTCDKSWLRFCKVQRLEVRAHLAAKKLRIRCIKVS